MVAMVVLVLVVLVVMAVDRVVVVDMVVMDVVAVDVAVVDVAVVDVVVMYKVLVQGGHGVSGESSDEDTEWSDMPCTVNILEFSEPVGPSITLGYPTTTVLSLLLLSSLSK